MFIRFCLLDAPKIRSLLGTVIEAALSPNWARKLSVLAQGIWRPFYAAIIVIEILMLGAYLPDW